MKCLGPPAFLTFVDMCVHTCGAGEFKSHLGSATYFLVPRRLQPPPLSSNSFPPSVENAVLLASFSHLITRQWKSRSKGGFRYCRHWEQTPRHPFLHFISVSLSYTLLYVSAYACMHTCVFTYHMLGYIHMYDICILLQNIYLHIRVCLYSHTISPITCMHTHIYILHIHIYVCVCVHMHPLISHTHLNSHTWMHACTHTKTPSSFISLAFLSSFSSSCQRL